MDPARRREADGGGPLIALDLFGQVRSVREMELEELEITGSRPTRPGRDIGANKVSGNLDRSVIDAAERVTDEESFAMVRRLVREEGLYVGGSAGTNLVAALRVAARGDVHGPVVTVMCDSWDRYRAKPWMQGWSEA